MWLSKLRLQALAAATLLVTSSCGTTTEDLRGDADADADGDGDGDAEAGPQCPSITITAPRNGSILSDADDEDPSVPGLQHPIVASADAPDGSTVSLFVDGAGTGEAAPVSGGQASLEGVTLPEGEHDYEVRVDGAPDGCDWPSITVTVDTVAPTCTITQPTGDDCLSQETDVSDILGLQVHVVVSTDAIGTATLLVDGISTEEAASDGTSADFDAVSLPEGTVELQARCVDAAGNVALSNTEELTVDTVAPPVEITTPPDGSFITAGTCPGATGLELEVCIETSAEPGDEACAFLDPGSPDPVTGCAAVAADGTACMCVDATALGRGPWTVLATVTDGCGNVGQAGISVEVASEAPIVLIIDPTSGAFLSFADDLDPSASGLQYDVVACASDAGTATLLDNGTTVPTTAGTPAVPTPCGGLSHEIRFDGTAPGFRIGDGLRSLAVDFVAVFGLTATSPAVPITVDTTP